MRMDNEYKNELLKKYRTELFETDDVDLAEIDGLVPNDELKLMIGINNSEMCDLLKQKPVNQDAAKRLFIANVNLYKLAKQRGLTTHGSSILMTVANSVGYDVNKLYDELSVGEYNRPYGHR